MINGYFMPNITPLFNIRSFRNLLYIFQAEACGSLGIYTPDEIRNSMILMQFFYGGRQKKHFRALLLPPLKIESAPDQKDPEHASDFKRKLNFTWTFLLFLEELNPDLDADSAENKLLHRAAR